MKWIALALVLVGIGCLVHAMRIEPTASLDRMPEQILFGLGGAALIIVGLIALAVLGFANL